MFPEIFDRKFTDRNFFGDGGGGGGRRSGAKGGQKWPIDGGPPAVALRHWC